MQRLSNGTIIGTPAEILEFEKLQKGEKPAFKDFGIINTVFFDPNNVIKEAHSTAGREGYNRKLG